MMRGKLALIAVSGFAIAAVCLGGAVALGVSNFKDSLIGLADTDLPRCDMPLTGQQATRSLAWDGKDSASIAVPANVHYHRGQGDQLVVTGDSALVSHVKLEDGSLRFNCRVMYLKGARMDVTLPGRNFRSFSLAGMGDMTLQGIEQPDLTINIAGAGDITADGTVKSLVLHVAGASNAKLADLAADKVALHIAGSGHIEVSPKDELKTNIVGSGTVMLHSEPRDIETHVVGSGRVIHPDGSVAGQHV
jgi:Putative auto-transporter adhesin, head GIN domain